MQARDRSYQRADTPPSDPKGNERPGSLPGGLSAGPDTRRRYSEAQRAELLAALEESGQPIAHFAAERGMSASTLHSWLARRDEKPKPRRKKRVRRYTPEQRRAAVEAFHRSGRTQVDFASLWGVSPYTISNWVRRYEKEGPKGLETRRVAGPGRPRTISDGVREEIARTKRRNPGFGMRKVRDWLARFRGIRVSAGTVQKTLREHDLADGPGKKRPRRKPKPPRRFERARAMQLWQSDITSFLLTRHSRRVYLTVFLDDRSRYVVAWGLESQQKAKLVIEPLMEGIARFGKPDEVLTDQGRQYFAWRGKSQFQKRLEREGIRHVVARTHHPQTLGKCERLWKTIDEEFWQRTRPQDLEDARERIGHYFAHYNHFRTHQGIDGLVPADRFFGAESTLRGSLEARMEADELGAALTETPRRSLYLFGQIGDQQVSLHGERGRVVVHTDEGELVTLAMDEMGIERIQEASRHEREEDTHPAQERALQAAARAGDPGAGTVEAGQRGGAGAGAPALHGGARVLARPGQQAADCTAPRHDAAARLANVPAGAERDAGGSVASAQATQEAQPPAAGAGTGSGAAQAADRGAGEEALANGGPGAGLEGPALGEGPIEGEERWSPRKRAQETREAPWGAGIPWH